MIVQWIAKLEWLSLDMVLLVQGVLCLLAFVMILERVWKIHLAQKGSELFRADLRKLILLANWNDAMSLSKKRLEVTQGQLPDLDALISVLILESWDRCKDPAALHELANADVSEHATPWGRSLVALAMISFHLPFLGAFGTVVGVIRAFHELSFQAASGVHTITNGIAEALVPVAIGILVAIPASIAHQVFTQRKRDREDEARMMASFIIGRLHLGN